MPSFDVMSEADEQEIKNAVEQVKKEIANRYDFKGAKASIELSDTAITMLCDDDLKLKSMQSLLRDKLAKRGVSAKLLEFTDPKPAGGDMLRQEVVIKKGLNPDELKKLNKYVKTLKMKVTAQTQGERLRVSGKKRDDLQEIISQFKQEFTDLELQFDNFRD